MPCPTRPHRSCSKEKERFYKPGEGLKTHQRFSHQGQCSELPRSGQEETKYDESLVNKAAFKLLQERQALDIRQFLENKCEQALANGTLNGSCCFTVQCQTAVLGARGRTRTLILSIRGCPSNIFGLKILVVFDISGSRNVDSVIW